MLEKAVKRYHRFEAGDAVPKEHKDFFVMSQQPDEWPKFVKHVSMRKLERFPELPDKQFYIAKY